MWENSENIKQNNPLLCSHSLKSPVMLNNTTYQENPFLRGYLGEILLSSAWLSRNTSQHLNHINPW